MGNANILVNCATIISRFKITYAKIATECSPLVIAAFFKLCPIFIGLDNVSYYYYEKL